MMHRRTRNRQDVSNRVDCDRHRGPAAVVQLCPARDPARPRPGRSSSQPNSGPFRSRSTRRCQSRASTLHRVSNRRPCSPTFTLSMSASPTVVVTCFAPPPMIVTVALEDDAPTVASGLSPTAATVPAIGLVSVACARFCVAAPHLGGCGIDAGLVRGELLGGDDLPARPRSHRTAHRRRSHRTSRRRSPVRSPVEPRPRVCSARTAPARPPSSPCPRRLKAACCRHRTAGPARPCVAAARFCTARSRFCSAEARFADSVLR